MTDKMFCYQCQETAKGSGCTVRGVCGKTDDVARLQDLLIYLLKGISFYSSKARELGVTSKKVDKFLFDGLFSTITNANFDRSDFTARIREGLKLKDEAKDMLEKAEGLLEVQTFYPSGKLLTFSQLRPVEIFGEAILFSKMNKFPATIGAIKDSKIMFIKKEDLISCLTNCHKFMENFLELLSNKLLILNKKVKMLSLESIRKKIGNFLMEEYKKQGSKIIKVSLSRKEMAEHMGIQRPSLSRELIKMRKEGIIEFDKKVIIIKDIGVLSKF